MACYEVAVDIKRGYVRANGRVAVSMSLPEGAETIIDLEKVYIADPSDYSVVLLTPLEASIETEENVLVAIFEAAGLLDAATNNDIVMVAGFIDDEVIIPVGETQEYDCLFGIAKFNKTIIGRSGSSNGGNGGHGGSGGHGGHGGSGGHGNNPNSSIDENKDSGCGGCNGCAE